MGRFQNFLNSDETIFKNHIALDYDFVPKVIKFREKEQQHIANCVKPMLHGRSGRNLIITGIPGIGKTVAVKKIFEEIEEDTDQIIPIHINCWKINTTYKIMTEICHQLGYKLTQNKKATELIQIAINMMNKVSVVLSFDEIDKAEDYDFLYIILEGVYRKTIFLITNYADWIGTLDMRIKSRLTPENLEFKEYNEQEVSEIISERIDFAFYPDVFDKAAADEVSKKSFQFRDIRSGLYLLKESANCAEDRSSRVTELQDVENALKKMDDFKIKKINNLADDLKVVLDIVKDNSGNKMGDVFEIAQKRGVNCSYKTFQRRIKKLTDSGFIKAESTFGGSEGNTKILYYSNQPTLDDFN